MRKEAKPRKRFPKRSRGQRLFRLLAALTVVCAFGWWFHQPYKLAYAEMQTVDALRAEEQQLKAENETLRTQYAALQTPSGRATEARALGYVWPKEEVIVLEDFKPEPPPAPKQPTPWERLKQRLFGK